MKKALLPTFAALGILALAAAAIFFYITANNNSASEEENDGNNNPTQPLPPTVASNSIYLDQAGADAVTVVEFLDFECEACGQFYPYVEAVREKYAGKINYVVRYFPLPGHFNSVNAALAAEAANQQGKFEEMYNRLFENQKEWGESADSKADLFRTYAVEIGLDMAAYDASIIDPASLERIEEDFNAGRELGIQSTPSFFINDEYQRFQRLDDLPKSIDAALKG